MGKNYSIFFNWKSIHLSHSWINVQRIVISRQSIQLSLSFTCYTVLLGKVLKIFFKKTSPFINKIWTSFRHWNCFGIRFSSILQEDKPSWTRCKQADAPWNLWRPPKKRLKSIARRQHRFVPVHCWFQPKHLCLWPTQQSTGAWRWKTIRECPKVSISSWKCHRQQEWDEEFPNNVRHPKEIWYQEQEAEQNL